MTYAGQLLPCRSVLFVNALAIKNSVDIDAAFESGADGVCIDLEDAVPPHMKSFAREGLFIALREVVVPSGQILSVRINSLRTLDGIMDMQAFLTQIHPVHAIVMPKVETADEIRWAAALANEARSQISFYSIIETVDGLENCRGIAQADPRVHALFFGGFDMSAALGAEMAWEPLLYARSRVVHAAASAQIQVFDSPFQSIGDLQGLLASATQARALGMSGKTAKDASQVATIQAAFTPDEIEIAHALHIVELFEQDPSAPLLHEGRLIELPTIKHLRRIAAFGGRRL